MSGILDKLKSWLRDAESVAETPVATAPGDPDRETSTNAQVQGAVGEPYPGND